MSRCAIRRSSLLLAGACCTLGFLLVSLTAAGGALLPADEAVLGWIAQRRDCASMGLAAALSVIGAGEVSLLITALLAAVYLAQRRPRAAVALLLLYVSVPIELALKHTLVQPLPGLLYPIPGACEWYHPTLSVVTPHSYPSGYAIRVTYFFALAAGWFIWQGVSRAAGSPRAPRFPWMIALALLLALTLLLASRLVLSWHWPSDLVGGALLGLALAAGTVVLGWPSPPATDTLVAREPARRG